MKDKKSGKYAVAEINKFALTCTAAFVAVIFGTALSMGLAVM